MPFGLVPPDLADPEIADYVRRQQIAGTWATPAVRSLEMLRNAAGAVNPLGPTMQGYVDTIARYLPGGARAAELEAQPGPKQAGALLPIMSNEQGQLWLSNDAGIPGSIKRGLSLAGDVRTGKTRIPHFLDVPQEEMVETPVTNRTAAPDPTSLAARVGLNIPSMQATTLDEGMSQIGDLVGLVAGGGIPAAEKGAVGIFGGKLAKGADQTALLKAQRMAHEGVPREAIWDQTGWFQGADKKWRFEIPDNKSVVQGQLDNDPTQYTIASQFRHPELYSNYPDARAAKMTLEQGPAGGRYNPPGTLRDEPVVNVIAENLPDARSVALHEGQHHVQQAEDFARGGNKDMAAVRQVARQRTDEARARAETWLQELQKTRDDWIAERMKAGDGITVGDAVREYGSRNPQWRAAFNEAVDRAYDSPKMFSDNATRAYRDLAGEVEARNVQTRRDFSLEERRAKPPWTTEDVPADRQIIVDGKGNPVQMSMEGGRYNGLLDDFAIERAVQRRGQGIPTGKDAAGWDFKRPEPTGFAREVAAARAGLRSDVGDAQASFSRNTNPLMTEADWAEVSKPTFTLGSGAVDEGGQARSAAATAGKNALDMSAEARMARAAEQGYTRDVYHGTQAPDDFTSWKRRRNDIGIHVGTAGQASDRISYMAEHGRPADGSRVMPLKANIKNPLRLPDLGAWGSENVAWKLEELFGKDAVRNALRGVGNEAGKTAALRDLIRSKGYDGIVYKNTGESGGPLTAQYRADRDAALNELRASQRARGKSENAFDREDQATPEYQRYSRAAERDSAYREETGEDSFIAFDPAQLRSTVAAFDPKNRGKNMILGSGSTDEAGQLRSQAAMAGKEALFNERAAAQAEPAPGAVGDGRGLAGRNRSVAEAQAQAARVAAGAEPLAGLPNKPLKFGDDHYVPGPIGSIRKAAEDYMAGTGRTYDPPKQYHPLDKDHSTSIAKAFDEMKHAPDDPAVKASYDAMIDETLAQWKQIEKTGLKVEFIKPGMEDPYFASPRLAAMDVADNNHLWVFPTESGFGTVSKISDNPMLRDTGITVDGHKMLANDVFRIVHDYFGHLKEGHGFRAAGEDNAWRAHSSMYSDLARPAMTSETRGQNSWVNYGPHGEKNRTATAADTVYADQKVGIMPEWTMRDRGSQPPMLAYHGTPHKHGKFDSKYLGTGEGEEVYGRGHYFAQAEDTAKHYRDILSKQKEVLQFQGKPVDMVWNDGIRENWADYIKTLPKSQRETFVDVMSNLSQVDRLQHVPHVVQSLSPAERRVFDERIMPHLMETESSPGHLYQVALDVNPEHLLNWDKLFRDQTGHVRDAMMPDMMAAATRQREASERLLSKPPRPQGTPLGRARAESDRQKWRENLRKSPEQLADETAGGVAYRSLGLPAVDAREAYGKATKRMLEVGVPGIRYLDQASRPSITKVQGGYVAEVGDKVLGPYKKEATAIRNAEKHGTSNYVVFDDKLIRILKRYGILLPGAGAAAELVGGFGSLAPPQEM